MKNNSSVIYAFSLIIGDFVALLAAFSVAYILRVSIDPRPLIAQVAAIEYLKIWALLAPFWLLIFGLLGLYRRNVYEYRWREIGGLLVGSCLGIMAVITYEFATKGVIFPARLVAVYGLLLAFLFLLLERTILRMGRMAMWRYNYGVTRVLIIGEGTVAKTLLTTMQNSAKTGYKVVAFVSKNKPASFNGDYFEKIETALANIQKLQVHTVVYIGPSDSETAENVLATAQANHCAFKFVPTHEGVLSNNIEVELFQGLPVVSVHQTALTGWGRIAKRLFDIISSLFAIIIFSPLLIILAIIIKVTDPSGKVLFKHKRLTRYGNEIEIIKFRSMRSKWSGQDAEEIFNEMGKPELAKEFKENRGKVSNDPRITPIGKFLRATSLDELPQLFNIFKGDISVVGPRAIPKKELQEVEEKSPILLSVKTGLTGLAQVSGRSNITFEERIRLDLYYVKNWSFWLDIKIIFRTIIDVLGGRGAK